MTVLTVNRTFPALRWTGEMDRLFTDFFGGFDLGVGHRLYGRPACPVFNVWEDDRNLIAEVEVPGLKMDDLEVFVLGDELTVKGEHKDADREGVTYHRRERGKGAFHRVLRLPAEIDADGVRATLCDGVLTITMPKAQSLLPRKIEVK